MLRRKNNRQLFRIWSFTGSSFNYAIKANIKKLKKFLERQIANISFDSFKGLEIKDEDIHQDLQIGFL